MISYIKGTIQYIGQNFLEVNNNNIGYKIYVSQEFLKKVKIGQDLEAYCFQNVREDTLDLFGFENREQLYLFEKLVAVSGIGPRTALGVLSLATVDEIESAIIRGDASILTKVSGIGKKTAERIVLELKNKFIKNSVLTSAVTAISSTSDADVIDALIGLGYSAEQARQALRDIDQEIDNTEDKLKACLQLLAK